MVRVPWNDPARIMKILDAGAYGVICPMINTRGEAEGLAEAAARQREVVASWADMNHGQIVHVAEDLDVDVFLSFGGNKIGQLTACGTGADTTPLTTIRLTGGKGQSPAIRPATTRLTTVAVTTAMTVERVAWSVLRAVLIKASRFRS